MLHILFLSFFYSKKKNTNGKYTAVDVVYFINVLTVNGLKMGGGFSIRINPKNLDSVHP